MNNKQLVLVIFLLLNILLVVFTPSWWMMGFIMVFLVVIIGFLLLTVGYFSYAYYKHLGDDPTDLIGPTELLGWYVTRISQFIEKGEKNGK